jgi:gluconolactonase
MNTLNKLILFVAAIAILVCCKPKTSEPLQQTGPVFEKSGSVERLSPELNQIIDSAERPEILATGFQWSEGPLWLADQNKLIFTDVPKNVVYQWTEDDSLAVYLQPSGFTDTTAGKEGGQGANGLLLDLAGNLVLCQHGDRRMARMDAPLGSPEPVFVTLADNYNGKQLNSPNDAVFNTQGDLFFTDPPYGLEKGFEDPLRELNFTGVFRLSTDGKLNLISDKMTAPNGIALSPDETRLYVTNSGDGDEQYLMVFDLNNDGTVKENSIFFKPQGEGHMDGLKVRKDGIIFTTGPGGVLVLTADGKHLGTIITGRATANCAFDATEDYLYITAADYLMRIKLK